MRDCGELEEQLYLEAKVKTYESIETSIPLSIPINEFASNLYLSLDSEDLIFNYCMLLYMLGRREGCSKEWQRLTGGNADGHVVKSSSITDSQREWMANTGSAN